MARLAVWLMASPPCQVADQETLYSAVTEWASPAVTPGKRADS